MVLTSDSGSYPDSSSVSSTSASAPSATSSSDFGPWRLENKGVQKSLFGWMWMTTLLIVFYVAVTGLSSFHWTKTSPPARNPPFYISMLNTSITKASFVVTSLRDRAGEGGGWGIYKACVQNSTSNRKRWHTCDHIWWKLKLVKIIMKFGHSFWPHLKLNVGEGGVPYRNTETTCNRDNDSFGDFCIKLKDLLVWSDAATRNGAIIAVDAGISLALLGISTSLVRNVNYFTAFWNPGSRFSKHKYSYYKAKALQCIRKAFKTTFGF